MADEPGIERPSQTLVVFAVRAAGMYKWSVAGEHRGGQGSASRVTRISTRPLSTDHASHGIPRKPSLRQVHRLRAELHDELQETGFRGSAGRWARTSLPVASICCRS